MGNLTSKGKHTVKAGSTQKYDIETSDHERSKVQCRVFKMHMKLRDQQIKTITNIQTAKPKARETKNL